MSGYILTPVEIKLESNFIPRQEDKDEIVERIFEETTADIDEIWYYSGLSYKVVIPTDEPIQPFIDKFQEEVNQILAEYEPWEG